MIQFEEAYQRYVTEKIVNLDSVPAVVQIDDKTEVICLLSRILFSF